MKSPVPCFYNYTYVGWTNSEKDYFQGKASIQEILNYKINEKDAVGNKSCLRCHGNLNKEFPLYETRYVDELPAVLVFGKAPWVDINQHIQFHVSNSVKEYILKGIIYTNEHHFTARLIDKNHTVWYHDGQIT